MNLPQITTSSLRPELLLELSLDEGDYSTEDTATEDEPDQLPPVEAQRSTIGTAQDADSEMEYAIGHRDPEPSNFHSHLVVDDELQQTAGPSGYVNPVMASNADHNPGSESDHPQSLTGSSVNCTAAGFLGNSSSTVYNVNITDSVLTDSVSGSVENPVIDIVEDTIAKVVSPRNDDGYSSQSQSRRSEESLSGTNRRSGDSLFRSRPTSPVGTIDENQGISHHLLDASIKDVCTFSGISSRI